MTLVEDPESRQTDNEQTGEKDPVFQGNKLRHVVVVEQQPEAEDGEGQAYRNLRGFVNDHRGHAARAGRPVGEQIGLDWLAAEIGQRRELIDRLAGELGRKKGEQSRFEGVGREGEVPSDCVGEVPGARGQQQQGERPLDRV